MNKKRTFFVIGGVVLLAIAGWLVKNKKAGTHRKELVRIVSPVYGNIQSTVATTGTVQPQNRLEIKPTISGRVEKILVEEGATVKKGDVLVWMSSTERAALLDAAQAQGEAAVKYWEEVYKLTPLIAPIDGEVIVKAVEPGQTVTSSEPVLVLSDRLIVNAQFDETDIGKVKVGREAIITLDAYPDINVRATVNHISYESQTVNNVTIYNVDIVPVKVPPVFRSGMSANIKVIENSKRNVLILPLEAVNQDKEGNSYVVLALEEGASESAQAMAAVRTRKEVVTGIATETEVEMVSGLNSTDKIIITTKSYQPAKDTPAARNPFMPTRPGRGRNR